MRVTFAYQAVRTPRGQVRKDGEPFLTEALSGDAQMLMQLCTGPTANLPLSGDITTAAWTARARPSR